MKKLSAALIALFMVTVMCFSSFAASITVTGVTKDRIYDVYRLFELTGSDTDGDNTFDLYSYTVDPDWVNFFIGTGAPGAQFLVEKTDANKDQYKGYNELTYEDPQGNRTTYFMYIGNGTDGTVNNVAELSQLALSYSVALTADKSKTADADGDLKFDNLELGYYLVYPQGAADIMDGFASICSLESTTPDGKIAVKATYPVIDKEVNDQSVEVGQTVTFTVKGQVPDTTGYDSYKYIVTDTMNDGLKFDGIDTVTVKIFGNDLTDMCKSLEKSGNGFRLEYDMAELQGLKGKEIVITYTATVTEEAVVKLTQNSAKLEYSNDPKATSSTYPNPPVEKEVYSSQIKVIKTDNASPSTALKSAKFSLISATPSEAQNPLYYQYTEATTTEPAKVTWTENPVEATVIETDDNGEAYFKGLEDGTYYLHEIEAPKGYSLLDHDVEIKIEGKKNDDGKMVGVTVEQTVINVPGKKLPATGGTGTTILYIIGGILVVGAGVLLITRKRVEREE